MLISAFSCSFISIHALCEEGDAASIALRACSSVISIHALCEEGDQRVLARSLLWAISIHALCEEGDAQIAFFKAAGSLFLSTPSARRATGRGASQPGTELFLSTPSARRATRCKRLEREGAQYFYPRPLRGGRPSMLMPSAAATAYFYPRPLRGGRPARPALWTRRIIFLSTPSARRATSSTSACAFARVNFYPRPLRGGRQLRQHKLRGGYGISIHALCEEGDG